MDVKTLEKLQGHKEKTRPLVMIIMDGIGIGKRDDSDGVHLAYTPVLDSLFKEELFTELKAHGTAVGLPSDKDMGNSEVGHNALGSGRVFSQGAQLVNDAISSGAIFEGEAWQKILHRSKEGGTLHFLGLCSDGNVHSHLSQLNALLDKAADSGIEKVRVHTLLDGRDVGEKSALQYIQPLEKRLRELSRDGRDYRIASGGGRMVVTMDRYEADWGIVERGWKAHVLGQGRCFSSASEAVSSYYEEDPDMTDQYMDSFVICDEGGKAVGTVEDGDSLCFFNFRGDRAIEISKAFEEDDFHHFDRQRRPDVFYAGMMQYDGDAHIPKNYLVEPPKIEGTIGEYFAKTGLRSYAISETQKYGHVTYFWNGNNSGYIDENLEEYEEILSDKVTFELRPWMKAAEISDRVIAKIKSKDFDFIRLNLANGDMVGHTGFPASIRIAVETVDLSLSRILHAVEAVGGIAVVTADHGNADCMWKEKKGKRSPHVAHTLNPVPFIVKDYSQKSSWKLSGIEKPGLANVAATLCTLLGYRAPQNYEKSIIELKQ